jgi:type VI secretion system secreted protein VgrG
VDREAPRALTEGEIALARGVFGDRIDYAIVRIRHGAGLNPIARLAFRNRRVEAIALIRTIFFKRRPPDDFSRNGDSGLFLHEMTHVWQYQALGVVRFYWRYLVELEAARFRAPDLYLYEPGKTAFPEARLEAQAQMVQDYHQLRGRGDEKAIAAIGANLGGSGFHGL